jgi:hypothetical protein
VCFLFISDVLGVSVLVECFWRDNAGRLERRDSETHFDMLLRVLLPNPPFVVVDVETQLRKWDERRAACCTFSAVARLKELEKEKEVLLTQAKRTFPTWIILTTQASGMSDAFSG